MKQARTDAIAQGEPGWLAGTVSRRCRLAAGELLFHQGQPSAGVYRVLSGAVRLQRVTQDGTEVAMHTARAGETFAEASVFADRYRCDAVALTNSEVLLYPRRALRERLRAEPRIAWELGAALAQQVHGLRTRLALRQVRSAEDRLLQYLRLQADARGRWVPPGTLKNLAADLGLSHEALYRALAALTRGGHVRRDGGVIELVQAARPR